MTTQTILYLIISAVIAAVIVYFQYFFRLKKTDKLHFLLSGLRFVGLWALILLLFNIKTHTKTTEVIKPDLILLADDSESIKVKELDSLLRETIRKIRNDKDLKARFNIKTVTFGKYIYSSDTLKFNKSNTDLQKALYAVDQVSSKAAVVLLTDGNQNSGIDYRYMKPKHKVFPIVFGDTTAFTDVKIDQVNFNPYVYEGNRFQIEVFSSYEGKDPVETELQVIKNKRVVFRKKLFFDQKNRSRRTDISLASGKKGFHHYKIYLKPLQNEQNTLNNEKRFQIEVLTEKNTVLLLYSVLHPDIAVWKRTLERNKQRKLIVKHISEFNGNISDYTWLLLFQPDSNFKRIFTEIEKKQINFLLQTGTNTDWSGLNRFQDFVKKTSEGKIRYLNPVLNEDFNIFQISIPDIEDYPPLNDTFGKITLEVPYQNILYVNSSSSAPNKTPVLSVSERNDQRMVFLFGEGIFRWRMYGFDKLHIFEAFDGMTDALYQFLQNKLKRSRLEVEVKPFYYSSEKIEIRTQVFDANFNLDTLNIPEIRVKNENDAYNKSFPMQFNGESYRISLNDLKEGAYEYKITLTGSSQSKKGFFEVLPYNLEQEMIPSDYVSLDRIAKASGGVLFFSDKTALLKEKLLQSKEFTAIQKEHEKILPIINQKGLLLLIVLSLSAEWFVRKYNGLI